MAAELKFGAVISWKGFEFDDGGSSDKLLVVLGAHLEKDIITVLTTSRRRPGEWKTGCYAEQGFFYFSSGEYGWPKDTWVQLYRPVVLGSGELVKASFDGDVRTVRNLPEQIAAAVRNCFRRTKDIAPVMNDLLE